MKFSLTFALFLIMMTSTGFASSGTYNYIVKGAMCTDGSWFNAAESIPVGTVIKGWLSGEELKKAFAASNDAFFLRGNEKYLFIKFKVGKNYEYASGRAPCDNESLLLISLERL